MPSPEPLHNDFVNLVALIVAAQHSQRLNYNLIQMAILKMNFERLGVLLRKESQKADLSQLMDSLHKVKDHQTRISAGNCFSAADWQTLDADLCALVKRLQAVDAMNVGDVNELTLHKRQFDRLSQLSSRISS